MKKILFSLLVILTHASCDKDIVKPENLDLETIISLSGMPQEEVHRKMRKFHISEDSDGGEIISSNKKDIYIKYKYDDDWSLTLDYENGKVEKVTMRSLSVYCGSIVYDTEALYPNVEPRKYNDGQNNWWSLGDRSINIQGMGSKGGSPAK